MNHDCPTGTHADRPSYVCYSIHGCRCDRCTQAKVDRNRYDRWNGNVPDDQPDWMDRLHLAERLTDLTTEVERLRQQVRRLEDRPTEVIRHKIVECDCDLPEPLPDRLPAGPLVDLVESRRRPVSDQLRDEALQAVFFRARKSGWLTFDAADRLSIALGHTLETLYTEGAA